MGVVALTLTAPFIFVVGAAVAKGKAKSDKQAAETTSSSDPAAFLVKPAEEALAARKFDVAVPLYRGIVAIRGDGDESVLKLSQALQLAGQYDAAADELERYVAAQKDQDKVDEAKSEIASLEARPAGFARDFVPVPATKQASDAFKRGRALFSKKQYADAIVLFKAGTVMAPDLPGPYRELGEALNKLGRSDEANEFFRRYLRLRPFGKNADAVREQLEKIGWTGKIKFDSSFDCDQVWMDAQQVPVKKLPAEVTVVYGRHRVMCFSDTYHFVHFMWVDVAKKGTANAKFEWAIIENALDPWGRIVLESPNAPDEFHDLGPSAWKEVGVPIPDDRRALRAKLKSGDGTKSKTVSLKLEPGKRVKVEW